MIYVTNEDKPGFIGSFAGLLGDARINIGDLPSRPRQAGRRRHRAWSRSIGDVPADVLAKVQALPQGKQGQGTGILRRGISISGSVGLYPPRQGRGAKGYFCCLAKNVYEYVPDKS